MLDIQSDTASSKIPPSATPCHFICGPDEFLVNREAQKRFQEATKDAPDDLSYETIEASCQNVAEVSSLISQFQTSAQTLSMFGDKKTIWLKSFNALADSTTGRAEGTKAELERLIHTLESLDPAAVCVIISASPVDRRTKIFKTLQSITQYQFLEADPSGQSLAPIAQAEAQKLGITFAPNALNTLLEKINHSSRMMISELHKLANYMGSESSAVTTELIHELIPEYGEGDFFEITEAFFSLDLNWTLSAIERFFFTNKEARPVLSALQNRGRLLLQLRTLLDSGKIRSTGRGIDKASLASAASEFNFPADSKAKSNLNLFTQNPWYLGKLAQTAHKIPLKRLYAFQRQFISTFEDFLNQPTAQKEAMQTLATHCLAS